MPIRQEQMIELMNESRAIHTYARKLQHMVLEYLSLLQSRYPDQPLAGEIANGLGYAVRLLSMPDDRITFDNERYYKRHAKANENFRKLQEFQRRAKGVPTQEEAIAMLHARNTIIRAGGEVVPTYAQFNEGPKPERRTRKKKSTPEVIFPHDDPDDLPLEFETLADMPQPVGIFDSGPKISIDPGDEPCDTDEPATEEPKE